MSFIWPWMLVALAFLPVGIAAYVIIGRRRRGRIAALERAWLGAGRVTRGRRIREAAPSVLAVVALAIIIVSLARPEAVLSLPRAEGTIILTVDVSGSMAADDVEPTRLEVAKAVARRFVEERPDGVIIGVVAFGDSGLSVQVPTTDQSALQRAIERLDPSFGTSLGEGILAALDTIARLGEGTPAEYYSDLEPDPSLPPAPIEPGARASTAIVLLTDGENTAPPEPADVAQAAADRGIRIHSVGVGTTAGTTLDLDGFLVHTGLDEGLLEHIAGVTAGQYFPLDPEAEDLADAVDLSAVYEELTATLVARDEHLEVTSLVAGSGVLLLVVAAAISLAVTGRLP